jgi:hypothetical protein
MTHPLTDDKLHDEYDGYLEEGWCNSIYCPDDMRAVADWQLKQVMKWLGKNLSNYTDDSYLGDMRPLHRLDDDLKEAMRPTQVASGREGALQALDRLCEENFDGLRRLAQEDN